ncbi:MAG TPA: sensory rhodopsin transducer [Myxococcales bacterium]|jgi:hypothetical protein|nr:sensory rhodopsin transducer [Myxococcales bacterium]
MEGLGRKRWVIAEGYLPEDDRRLPRPLASHEAACILNASDREARVRIRIYFADREPAGPYERIIPPRRTLHLRFDDLQDPPIPRGTDYSSVIESDVPVVVQHTRLDARRSELALLSTVAFPVD